MSHALIVMQDRESQNRLAEAVRAEAFRVTLADGVEAGVKRIEEDSPDLLLLDLCFRDGSAVDLLDVAKKAGVGSTVLVGAEGGESPEESLRRNVTAFLGEPFNSQALRTILNEVANSATSSEEVARERDRIESGHFGRLVGNSDAMRRLYDLLSRIAPSQASVFISGESGVGKELVARTIHDLSRRRRKPFIPVNCGAISPSLMESELFGHERGSFSGASRQRRGYFEQADGGTLFLDEVTEMPTDLQVKLLRVLESGKVMRVGGEQLIQVDVRILAATNREPKAAIEENRLREDLYYRLRVLHIGIPPLRERSEDIPLLAQALLQEISEREGVSKELCPDILEVLKDYDWPGNVRELRNALYTAYLLSDGARVVATCLPPEVRGGIRQTEPGTRFVYIPVGTPLKEAERRLILTTLAHLEGRKSKTAETLGVSVKTLYNRLHHYGYMEKEAEEEEGAT